MKCDLFLIVSFFFLLSYAQEPIFVVNIFRHGSRFTTSTEFSNVTNSTEGQLTATGMREHFLLGQIIGTTYSQLLKPYSPGNIYIRSTNVDGTIIASAFSQLFGVYLEQGPNVTNPQTFFSFPPYNPEDFNVEGLGLSAMVNNVQAIPVHMVDQYFILGQVANCPNADLWEQINYETNPTFLEAVEYLNDLFLYINETYPNIPDLMKEKNVTYWDVIGNLCDAILCARYNGEPYPNNFDYENYGRAMMFLDDLMNVVEDFGTETQIKIYSGPLLNTVYQYLVNASIGIIPEKFIFFSGHQSTLIAVLSALGVISPECMLSNYEGQTLLPFCYNPGFSSNIQFVLSSDLQVSVFYNGTQYPLCQSEDGSCNLIQLFDKIIEGTGGYGLQQYLEICNATINSELLLSSIVVKYDEQDYKTLNFTFGGIAVLLGSLIFKVKRSIK